MSEPTDNIPLEWPKRGKWNGLRERISEAQWRRRMVDFAKFVAVHVYDALEPDELLDAWIEQTYNKRPRKPTMKLGEIGEPTLDPEYFPKF